EHAAVHRLVVHRDAVHDEQRLVAAADRADAADRDLGGRARYAGAAVHLDAGDAALQRTEEVVALRIGDRGAGDALLRRAERSLDGRLTERGDDDGVEARRDLLQLDVDHVGRADRTLFRRRADLPEDEHLSLGGADGVASLGVRRRAEPG